FGRVGLSSIPLDLVGDLLLIEIYINGNGGLCHEFDLKAKLKNMAPTYSGHN
ncbi:MAG: hypothetical protein RLZZ557_1470, partial [Bacteroidota bacterium]